MNWLSFAKKQPVAFAQVREDSLLDLQLVNSFPKKIDVLMVASGGCTAALLATSKKVARLHLVDPNPAQLALTKLKLSLLTSESPRHRMKILGHLPYPKKARKKDLLALYSQLGLKPNILGPMDWVAQVGPDSCGRYELLFQELRRVLAKERHNLVRAFELVMSLPNLVALFGSEATANRVQPFWRHFLAQTSFALARANASKNPYLAQLLLGHFHKSTVTPWLNAVSPRRLPEISLEQAFMDDALKKYRSDFEFIHLSNILDWLSPAKAKATLDKTYSALKNNGVVIIRQLNSNLNIPVLGKQFKWDKKLGASLLKKDRSFFYRNIYVGRKVK